MRLATRHALGTVWTPTRALFGVRLEPSGWGGGSPVLDAHARGERVDRAPEAGGRPAMKVWQAGSHLTMQRGAEVNDWSWARTVAAGLDARPAGGAVPAADRPRRRLASRRDPDRARAAAPGQVRHRRRDQQGRRRGAHGHRRALRRRRPRQPLRERGADLLHRLDGRADPRRPAQQALRPPPAPLARLLRAEPGRRHHQPPDERRRSARPARHGRGHEPVPEQPPAPRLGRHPLLPRLAPRAGGPRRLPADGHRDEGLPRPLLARVPQRPRAPRARHGDARRGHRGNARRAVVHAGGHEPAPVPLGERPLPRVEPGDRHPQRPLLPVRRLPRGRGHGHRARLRRLARVRGRGHGRHALRLPPLPLELLRPDPAAVAALQHVPLGHGRAGQDHGRHGRGAAGRRQPGRPSPARDRRRRRRSRTCASATATGPRSCTGSTSPSRPGRRSRSSATPVPASRRSPSSWRASTTRARAGSRSTATTSAT